MLLALAQVTHDLKRVSVVAVPNTTSEMFRVDVVVSITIDGKLDKNLSSREGRNGLRIAGDRLGKGYSIGVANLNSAVRRYSSLARN